MLDGENKQALQATEHRIYRKRVASLLTAKVERSRKTLPAGSLSQSSARAQSLCFSPSLVLLMLGEDDWLCPEARMKFQAPEIPSAPVEASLSWYLH